MLTPRRKFIFTVSSQPILRLDHDSLISFPEGIVVYSNLKKCTPSPFSFVSSDGRKINSYQSLSKLSKSGFPIILHNFSSPDVMLHINKFVVV